MNDYISRDAAIVRATAVITDYGILYDVKEALDDIPAADVQPVRRGRWILIHTVGEEPDVLEQYWECSLCGCGSDSYDTVYHTPYCPNCGARMEPAIEEASND